VNYTVEEKSQKETEIPNGKGEKLEQMPNVVNNFKAITWSNPVLHDFHSIVFGQGKKKHFKGHLLQFNGVVYSEGKEATEKDKFLAKMYKLKMADLRAVMDLADVDRSAGAGVGSEEGTTGKEALCNHFLKWLEKPKASDKTKIKKKGKRKSTGSSETKKRTSAKKARKTTPAKAPDKKEKSSAKKNTPKTEKASKKAKTNKSTPKSPNAKAPRPVYLNIPGVSIDKVRAKVKFIVENADKAELTVKGVRKMLEDWLDTDLVDHKDAIRSIVMEVM